MRRAPAAALLWRGKECGGERLKAKTDYPLPNAETALMWQTAPPHPNRVGCSVFPQQFSLWRRRGRRVRAPGLQEGGFVGM